jgi:lipoprotein NlpD
MKQITETTDIRPVHRLSTMMTGTISVMLGCAVLAGCASRPTVTNTAQQRLVVVPEFYTVKRGDTLGGIAARYGLDYRELGRMNQVDNSYTIYAEQRLRLRSSGSGERIRVLTPQGATVAKPLSATQLPATAVAASRPTPTRLPAPAAAPTPSIVIPALTSTVNTSTTTPRSGAWIWPVNQPILDEFNLAKQIKGIRFSGAIGLPVMAAADGEVVYADDGLQEYGKLVLIRHLNGYISAYAHNSRLLVKENERVNAGQTIAEMGNSGTDRVMLEFQVRLNGKPVDPRGLLPNR